MVRGQESSGEITADANPNPAISLRHIHRRLSQPHQSPATAKVSFWGCAAYNLDLKIRREKVMKQGSKRCDNLCFRHPR